MNSGMYEPGTKKKGLGLGRELGGESWVCRWQGRIEEGDDHRRDWKEHRSFTRSGVEC